MVYAHEYHLGVYDNDPDDPFFVSGNQSSLAPTTQFPNAHVNVEPAWDIVTGKSYVKVGVLDSPVYWQHEDFGGSDLANSQVVDGFDYKNQVGIANFGAVTHSHGTSCAGIIGALRFNNLGIAGIAGGGLNALGEDSDGVSLYSMGIGSNEPDLVAIYQAIVFGALDANVEPSGFAQHIQNNSWSFLNDNPTLEAAVSFAWRNECIFVAARGNLGTNALRFPACFDDRMVLNIGGSGTNGQYFDGDNGLEWAEDAELPISGSSFGGGMDLLAPFTTENILTLIFPAAPTFYPSPQNNFYPAPDGTQGNYQVFHGTSSAVPHVVGIAALMCTLHNIEEGQPNNLAPEDVEHLLEQYATDLLGGDNEMNGSGRANAFESVRRLEGPQWQVFHNSAPNSIQTTTTSDQVWVLGTWFDELPPGVYVGDLETITHNYSYTFPANTQIIDYWERWSGTDGVNTVSPLINNVDADFVFSIVDNTANITVTTNVIHFTSNFNNSQTLDLWFPMHPDEVRTAFSLHLFDPTISNLSTFEFTKNLSISPNPTSDQINISFALGEGEARYLQIVSITGEIQFLQAVDSSKQNMLSIEISNYPTGVYLCQLITDRGIISKKWIKH